MTGIPVNDLGLMNQYTGSGAQMDKTVPTADFSDSLKNALKDNATGAANGLTQNRQSEHVSMVQKSGQSDRDAGKTEAPAKTDKADETEAKEPSGKEVLKAKNDKQDVSDKEAVTDTSAEKTKNAEDAEVEEETLEVLNTAAMQLVEEIAATLDLSQETVLEAVSALEGGALDLFDAEKLSQLVLDLTGAEDMSAVLTDENLYANLKTITGVAEELTNQLEAELELTPAQLEDVLTQAKEQLALIEEGPAEEIIAENVPEAEKTIPVLEGNAQNAPKTLQGMKDYTVTTTKDGETITTNVTVDDVSGEETAAAVVRQSGTKENQSENHKESEQGSLTGQENGFAQSLGGVNQTDGFSVVQTPEMPPEIVSQTREIADQILEYMKVELKPEMTQMELSLHPASLGNVTVSLTAREGAITAQFTAQNETVRAAIETQVVELKEQLQEQGIKVEAVEVTIANYQQHPGEEQQSRQDASQDQPAAKKIRQIRLEDLEDEEGLEELEEPERIAADMMARSGNSVDFMA